MKVLSKAQSEKVGGGASNLRTPVGLGLDAQIAVRLGRYRRTDPLTTVIQSGDLATYHVAPRR